MELFQMKSLNHWVLKRPSAFLVPILSLASILLPGTWDLASHAADKAKAKQTAGPKQYIFSRSATQTTSNKLAFTGVPAYVNFPDGSQKCGVYVTQSTRGGAAARMGLLAGTVLITINNQVASSPQTLDGMLGTATSYSYSYVKLVGGLPKIMNSTFSPDGSAAAPPAFVPFGYHKPSTDNTPISTLESYMEELVNDDRRKTGGLSGLSRSSKLEDLARSYAEHILQTKRLEHVDEQGRNPHDRAVAVGIVCGIRENLSQQPRLLGKADKEYVANAEQMMMAEAPNQPNHRGNILCTDSGYIGVGVARNQNMLIMVQEIAASSP
jgi:uncharacterized protein YkwD